MPTSQLGVNITLLRFIQQRAAAALRPHYRPRILLCAPPETWLRLAASTQYEFIPHVKADPNLLRVNRQQPLDGVLIHYELGIGNNDVLEFMDVAGEEFRKLPCLVLCHQEDRREISKHGWRVVAVGDMTAPSEIEEKLELALFLFPWMRRDVLRNTLALMKVLPAGAARHQHIVRHLRSSPFALEEAVALIKQDAALSAQIIHVAGAPAFSGGKPVENVDAAVSILGCMMLRALIASGWVFFMNHQYACKGFDPKTEWNHALEVTDEVRKICEFERVDGRTAQTAITAALLHDLGKWLLAARRPTDYGRVLARVATGHGPSWQLEDEMLGFNHAELAGCLLALWGAPLPVAEEVMLHHSDVLDVWSPAYLIQRVHPKFVAANWQNTAKADEADTWGNA